MALTSAEIDLPPARIARVRELIAATNGGNSSGIVDGAAAALVASSEYLKRHKKDPLARVVAGTVVGASAQKSWASRRYRQFKLCWTWRA